MKLYDLLAGMYETKAIVYINIWVIDQSGVHYFKEIPSDCVNYRYSSNANVDMFKATKKGCLEVHSSYRCENMNEFTDLVDRINGTIREHGEGV